MTSNLPPGETGGGGTQEFPHRCKNGHEAKIPMHYELGGWFYLKDEDGECPVCHEEWLPDGLVTVRPEKPPQSAPRPATGRAAVATILGLAAALAGDLEPLPRGLEIRHGEMCTACGEIGGHKPGCTPPRAFKRV